MEDSIVGDGSCTGKNACQGLKTVTISSNSFNGKKICTWRTYTNNIVPNNACNVGLTDDFTDGKCNYCSSAVSNEIPPIKKKKKKTKTSKKNAAPPKKM